MCRQNLLVITEIRYNRGLLKSGFAITRVSDNRGLVYAVFIFIWD
jgi:hypothetical protein